MPSGYDPRAYEPFAVTVDVVALTIRGGALHVLLVERGEEPYAGRFALPGGFVRAESLDDAAARELAEETGLALGGEELRSVHLEQLATYGNPGRDPRMRVVTVAYLAFAAGMPDPVAGGDAASAMWTPVDGATRLAFDHDGILADGLERARSKLEYTPLATSFVGPEFTIAELRAVYAAVWGVQPHAGNFHRKVLATPGFVVDTGTMTGRGGERGGRRSRLYRAGGARLLHPALLRPDRSLPDRLSSDRLFPDRLFPDRLFPDRLSSDRLSSDRLFPGRSWPAERGPLARARSRTATAAPASCTRGSTRTP